MAVVKHKESIHSGQFMVSNFDAEDEDSAAQQGPNDVVEYDESVDVATESVAAEATVGVGFEVGAAGVSLLRHYHAASRRG